MRTSTVHIDASVPKFEDFFVLHINVPDNTRNKTLLLLLGVVGRFFESIFSGTTERGG